MTDFVIKYTDGCYNFQSGFPCQLFEATRYPTREAAEEQAKDLVDVECIEELPQ